MSERTERKNRLKAVLVSNVNGNRCHHLRLHIHLVLHSIGQQSNQNAHPRVSQFVAIFGEIRQKVSVQRTEAIRARETSSQYE